MPNETIGGSRAPSLINRAAMRRFARDVGMARPHQLSRVSGDFLDSVEAHVRNYIVTRVQGLPSVGKTIT